jgi:hypothetical protein
MKRRTLRIGLLVLLAVILVAGAVAMKSSNYQLNWLTPGTSNGGGTSTSANYVAHFTVGQAVIGQAASANYKADLGYWYGLLRQFRRFLPVVMENMTY